MGRIALCGVFDIPNYGDHLFPLVLREELSRRGYAGNVVLFSPFQAEESFVENSNVHSLDDLERMHMEEPFSAIVVGGGEIIHWHRFGQKRTFNSTDFEAYPMDKVWLVPCFMKMKYNVPLLWNAPGIPFDFDADKALAHYLFSNIDYLSVRNDFSKQVLIDCGIPDAAIQRVPDTGFSLKNVATDQELHDARNHVFPGLAHYAVFHCNRFIPESEINNVVATSRNCMTMDMKSCCCRWPIPMAMRISSTPSTMPAHSPASYPNTRSLYWRSSASCQTAKSMWVQACMDP